MINPWCVSDIKHALNTSLQMNTSERAVMHSHLSSYVEKFTAERWGTSFVNDLIDFSQSPIFKDVKKLSFEDLNQLSATKVETKYKNSGNPQFLDLTFHY